MRLPRGVAGILAEGRAQTMAERGDIILDGLLRIVVGILLSALVLFEVGAVVVNQVQVDSKSQSAARAGATAWSSHGDAALTEEAVESVVGGLPEAQLTESSIQGDAIKVTVRRQAPVLVVQRLSFLEERLVAEATARAEFDR